MSSLLPATVLASVITENLALVRYFFIVDIIYFFYSDRWQTSRGKVGLPDDGKVVTDPGSRWYTHKILRSCKDFPIIAKTQTKRRRCFDIVKRYSSPASFWSENYEERGRLLLTYKYLIMMECHFDAMLWSNMDNENCDAGHKTLRGPHLVRVP